jgi:hypothetical protein
MNVSSIVPLGLLLGAAAAQAAPQAVLDTREAVTFVSYVGGFAIAGDNGTDGSLTPVTALEPPRLSLDGSHTYIGAYLGWSVTYSTDWALTQTWTLDPHTLAATGSLHVGVGGAVVGPNCNPCLPSMQNTGRNNQAFEFGLDGASGYAFHSVTTKDQYVDLLLWSDPAQRWTPLWSGFFDTQATTFDRAGTLQPGRYRLQNNPYDVRADGGAFTRDNAWDYALTLADAGFVSAVPAPGGALLMAAGVVTLLCRRRGWRGRRAAG